MICILSPLQKPVSSTVHGSMELKVDDGTEIDGTMACYRRIVEYIVLDTYVQVRGAVRSYHQL
jgi:hypothetical protein